MMHWLRTHLARSKPERIAADYLYEARIKLVEAEAAAEEWASRAALYRNRIARLTQPRIGIDDLLAGRHTHNINDPGQTHSPTIYE